MDTLPQLQQPHFRVGSHVTQARCCCFSPDGSTILSGSDDKTLKLWRKRDGLCNSSPTSGLPIGPALELKEKCETLKQSFFSFVHQQRE